MGWEQGVLSQPAPMGLGRAGSLINHLVNERGSCSLSGTPLLPNESFLSGLVG